ncbi:PaaX family transcriptional regulator C-terminal domain-containing protein [Planomonospora parontospora]|uniref:PaaX family transcriptional regulator C-terminal domain-containing protein n=1 Tax=Planomonospora parontospora TaxID=58119 RepID=UPI001943E96A|nr:PaaX family transcriptional regulator C-terminal domain-containing protein [Planomonospora parontospora]GGL57268.1 putative repressor in the phenylacetic acid catabolism [Planomonospora parontospora subsp. antibiotica]GII20035.1 putative repressor in the phenylacetic acid catabolism [Planomonospora parontospora subsp. antibiotica]
MNAAPHLPGPDVQVPTRMLVEALVRTDLTVDTGELYATGNLLGMTDQQVRLCIKRLVAEGRFHHEGRGRKGLLRATGATEQLLGFDAEFIAHAFRQDAGLAPWDGTWHLVAFAVPETARTARDALRAALTRLGGAPLQGGLYLSANPWERYVEDHARHLDVLSHLTFATTRDLRRGDQNDPAALVRALWPLDEIAERYHRLAAVARPRLERLRDHTGLSEAQRLTIAVELAAEFTRAMEPDPLLPPQLLPHPWPGSQARALVAQCWSLLNDNAEPDSEHTRLFRLYGDVESTAAPRT